MTRLLNWIGLRYRRSYVGQLMELGLQASWCAVHKAGNRRQAMEDLGWALINSKEFLFRH